MSGSIPRNSPSPCLFGVEEKTTRPKSEHIFVTGSDIGMGTVGLGPEAARKARQKLRNESWERYWANKAEQTAGQYQRERQRLGKIAASQAGSARHRLMIAKAAHEEEIRKMTIERKQFEKAFKEKQEEEAKVRNEHIRREKEYIKRQLEEAKLAREARKERELAKIRADRREMLEIREMEQEAERLVAEEHAEKVREWQEISKKRAAEEAEQRFKERCEVVKEINVAQEAREVEAKQTCQEIVVLKGDILHVSKQRMRVARLRVDDAREKILVKNAAEQRVQVKERADKRREMNAEWVKEKVEEAREKKHDIIEAREQYKASKSKKFEELRREAREQKALAKVEMELEKEEQRQAHAEYIALMKELMSRKSRSPSPDGRTASATPSPPGKRGSKTHPAPMSPSKLAEH